ncbi:monovalent cation/H(+) antiporter subunit G [Maricaulis sp.]|uniref:monovalent cation/H(+) antiporter subunit G n=1 Tax=Maricaulis sp. TaxID=1486257 RepID=UPI002B2760F8|nr:monovalent cation/H(+) antiporter subunit G [Maricaulis sp.]
MSPAEIFQHARDVFAIGAMAVGLVFVIAGATGVMRLPDFYTRMHAAGVTDTLGAELIILGLIAQAGDWQTAAKLALVGLLLFLTSPTATHAIANAAHRAGQKPDLSHFKPKHPADAGASEGQK